MSRIVILALASLASILSGCAPKSSGSTEVEETVTLGPQYSDKTGLFVPDDTRQSLGLTIVDVAEQEIAATIDVALRIYKLSASGSLASGMLTPDQAAHVKVGDSVMIQSGEGGSVTGRIATLDDQVQKATGMIEVLAEIPNSSTLFAVGDFLRASVAPEPGGSVVTVPRSALLQCSDGYSVYTVSGEHFVRTQVKVGAVNAALAEIQDGLYAGDQVVSRGAMSLWMTELAAVKGGQACCVAPPKGK